MSALTDLVWWLKSQAAVTALVSTRITPMPLPQGSTLPAITYWLISTPREYVQTGRAGLARARVQIDVWASTYLEAQTVAEAVVTAFDGWHDTLGNVAFVEGPRDGYETDTKLYRKLLDVTIHYEE